MFWLLLAFIGVEVIVLLGGAIGVLILRASLVRALRQRHLSIWTHLGSPAAVGYDSGVVWKWVWSRKYKELNDPKVIRLANAFRFVNVAFISATVVAIILALIGKILR